MRFPGERRPKLSLGETSDSISDLEGPGTRAWDGLGSQSLSWAWGGAIELRIGALIDESTLSEGQARHPSGRAPISRGGSAMLDSLSEASVGLGAHDDCREALASGP